MQASAPKEWGVLLIVHHDLGPIMGPNRKKDLQT
jgi:hypothetical protein